MNLIKRLRRKLLGGSDEKQPKNSLIVGYYEHHVYIHKKPYNETAFWQNVVKPISKILSRVMILAPLLILLWIFGKGLFWPMIHDAVVMRQQAKAGIPVQGEIVGMVVENGKTIISMAVSPDTPGATKLERSDGTRFYYFNVKGEWVGIKPPYGTRATVVTYDGSTDGLKIIREDNYVFENVIPLWQGLCWIGDATQTVSYGVKVYGTSEQNARLVYKIPPDAACNEE